MKILDIITPDQTLDEGKVLDALKGVFNKRVSEPLGIFFGKRPPKKIVAEWVDGLLAGSESGQQFSRNSEIKAAESKLVSILENSPFPDKADAKKIEYMADSLVDWMFKTGKTALPEGNALKTLYTLVEQDAASVPKGYGSKAEFLADEFVTKELGSRVIVPGDDRFLTDGNVGKYVRELSDAKVNVVWEADKIVNPKPSGFDKLVAKIAEVLKQNAFFKSQFNPLRLANITRGFTLFELNKILHPFAEQIKLANQWHESKKDMPPSVAERFPPAPGTSISTIPTYTYSTEKERYDMAYNWTVYHLAFGTVGQLFAWGTANWASKALLMKAGTMGKWTWTKVVFNNIEILQRNPHVDQVLKAYMATMSQYSRLLFVDYLTNASNGDPRSDSLGKQLQRLAFDERQPIREYPKIQNLPESFALMTADNIFDLHAPQNQYMLDALKESGVIFTAHYVAIRELAIWAVETATPPVMKMIDKLIDPAKEQVIPQYTTSPLDKKDQKKDGKLTKQTDTDQTDLSGEKKDTGVVPAAPAASAPAASAPAASAPAKGKIDPSIFDVKESLKKRVEKLMRS